jgi:hypothetical protein
MKSPPNAVDPSVAALLGTAIAAKTIEALIQKGAITQGDGYAIYAGALATIPEPREQAAARHILTSLMPGLKIND